MRLGSSAALLRVSRFTPTETEKLKQKSAPPETRSGPRNFPEAETGVPAPGWRSGPPEPVRHVGTALKQRPLSAAMGTARVCWPVLGVHDDVQVKTGRRGMVPKICGHL